MTHGFGRAQNGGFTTFEAPDAATGESQGTFAGAINAEGAIAGYFQDSSSAFHAFLRAVDGELATFDAPGKITTCSFHHSRGG